MVGRHRWVAAAQFPQRWLRSYVGSKLRSDPVFPTAYDLFCGSDKPILDVGCGLGLLALYLRERGCQQPILGLDVDARKIRRGMSILQGRYTGVDLRCQDVTGPIPDFSGEIALFDVLHYLPVTEQTALLSRLAKCVAPGGSLVIRDCPRDQNARFWMTYAAEKFAQTVSWNLNTPLHFPSRESISEPFDKNEFERESRPLWGKSPFNNRLFVFTRVGALRGEVESLKR
jgi:2-polyprenyl-3-methyl-5-hydroxy-6-metoxy-1,4-benzoquinol methylase